MTKITTATEIHDAIRARGYAPGSYSFMGCAAIHCCEIRVSGFEKVRGVTWEKALDALDAGPYPMAY